MTNLQCTERLFHSKVVTHDLKTAVLGYVKLTKLVIIETLAAPGIIAKTLSEDHGTLLEGNPGQVGKLGRHMFSSQTQALFK